MIKDGPDRGAMQGGVSPTMYHLEIAASVQISQI